jgi:UDP-N-acetylmuramate--alanine ligase
MTALADILASRGALVTGSDTADTFYTDAILRRLGIPVLEGFAATNVPPDAELLVHSAAYDPTTHVEVTAARSRGVPIVSYPEALGALSRASEFVAITGVHGKSTTTAMAGIVLKHLGLPVTVLVGTEVPGFGGRSVHCGGDRYLVAESCEYRRHFLNYSPTCMVVTGAEAEHLDYFRDRADVISAFVELAERLPQGGELICCADDAGAREIAASAAAARPDLRLVPYGTSADGPFRVAGLRSGAGALEFSLGGERYRLRVPGRHNVLNAAAAIAVARHVEACEGRGAAPASILADALWSFTGTRRRSEVIGEAAGVLFVDDYGHHPTEISVTLAALREFYPGRRLVVDFMSHTYSRTQKLFRELAGSFGPADLVVLHRIYASARESNPGGISGRDLYEAVAAQHPAVLYYDDPPEAVAPLAGRVRSGDLFVTMGAGDNWKVGRELMARLARSGG